MASEYQANAAAADGWRVQTLRLTAFASGTHEPSSWWQSVFGEPAEQTTTLATGAFRQEGIGIGGRVRLGSQGNRADWLLGPIVLDEEVDLPELGAFSDVVPKFAAKLRPWAAQVPNVVRLAFGAILTIRAENKADAVRKLVKHAAINFDPTNCEEFQLVVNRPRTIRSIAAEVLVHRVAKWTAASLVKMAQSIQIGQTSPTSLLTMKSVGQLELDINTTPERVEPFGGGELAKVLDELVKFAQEISQRGDVL